MESKDVVEKPQKKKFWSYFSSEPAGSAINSKRFLGYNDDSEDIGHFWTFHFQQDSILLKIGAPGNS